MMKRAFTTIVAFAVLFASPMLLASESAACEGLDAAKQRLFEQMLGALHPYDCCDETLAACLKQSPVCPLVPRLVADVCRLVKEGKTQADIEHAILRRAQSMTPGGQTANIELDDAVLAGDADAPVTLVLYACTRCPFCRVVTLDLYKAVTEGSLKGKAKLYFRAFPLKDHPGSLEGGLALIAAARMGNFWPYTVKLYQNYGGFSLEALPEWAVEIGMDLESFNAHMGDAATREALNRAKQEGIRNRVNATPTLFINGRRYVYENTMPLILELVDEEVERVKAAKK